MQVTIIFHLATFLSMANCTIQLARPLKLDTLPPFLYYELLLIDETMLIHTK